MQEQICNHFEEIEKNADRFTDKLSDRTIKPMTIELTNLEHEIWNFEKNLIFSSAIRIFKIELPQDWNYLHNKPGLGRSFFRIF